MLIRLLKHNSFPAFISKNSLPTSVRYASGLHNRDYLKERLSQLIPEAQKKMAEFKAAHQNTVIDQVTVGQVFGGMRDIKAIYHEPSLLDINEGIRFRGMTCDEVREKLPRAPGGEEPLPEGVFWLLLTGEIPTTEQVRWLSSELNRRAEIPYYLSNIINIFPDNLHPMAQFSASVTMLSKLSKFAEAYNSGTVSKSELWKPMYEDCMDLVAKVPVIAAKIYRNCFHDGSIQPLDHKKDWSGNYANMLGINDNPLFTEFMRLYLTMHSDHEGGNVSSHTASLVGSALSDVYLSFGAAMNGLAGPLHGRANQEVMEWLRELIDKVGINNLTDEKILEFCHLTLKSGVIPGFGHAVLRKTDPRYTVQRKFAEKHIRNDKIIDLLDRLYHIVPQLLSTKEKIKNPWPNVDAISGSMLDHYSLTELEYYTVPFGVSRSIGIASSLVWARALALPIERPKSLDMNAIKQLLNKEQKK